MTDIVASKLPAGAGRFQDFVWPDPLQLGAGINSNSRPRVGMVTAPGNVANIGGGTTSIAAVQNGVPCVQVPSAVASGTQKQFYPGFSCWWRTSKSLISPRVDDAFVYRFLWNFAGAGIALVGARDFGFEIVRFAGPAVVARLVGDNVPGIGFRIQDANTLQFLVNGPNGLQTVNLTAAPFDTTKFHSIDLRVFCASATADASLTVRLDDSPVALSTANSSWSAGTNLPAMQGTGSFVGFVPTIVSDAAANNSFFVQTLRMICAPSELMTL
jgi:hypothetical protein